MADLGALFEYFQAVLPLTLAHLAVPPISSFQLATQSYVDTPPPEIALFVYLLRIISPPVLKDPDFIIFLIQEKLDVKTLINSPEKAFNHRSISHLFVHYNYQHLVSNLMSLFNVGEPLFQEHGPLFFYMTFFLGGVTASLPLLELLGPHPVATTSNLTIRPELANSNLTDLFRHGMKKAILTVSSAFKIETKYFSCGSSGAVCALLGGSTVVTIKQFLSSARRIYRIYQEEKENGGLYHSYRSSRRRNELNTEIFKCLRYLLTCSYTIDFLHSQIASHYKQQQLLSERTSLFPWTSLFSAANSVFIDYQAHLQGFAFGAIATMGMYAWRRYKRAMNPGSSYWDNRSFRRLRD